MTGIDLQSVLVLAAIGGVLAWQLVGISREYLRCRDLSAQLRIMDALQTPDAHTRITGIETPKKRVHEAVNGRGAGGEHG